MLSFGDSQVDIVDNDNRLKRYSAKIVLLGNTGVGKSSLALQFTRHQFYCNQDPTIGACFLSKKVRIHDSIINFEIWDTAGQERFHSLTPMYYRGASAALIVYDITDPSTYAKAKMWVHELQRSANPDIVIMLVCNKIDLKKGEIDTKEAKNFAKENNILFIETSAKDNQNVTEMFKIIAEMVPKIEKKIEPTIVSLKSDEQTKRSYCCYRS